MPGYIFSKIYTKSEKNFKGVFKNKNNALK